MNGITDFFDQAGQALSPITMPFAGITNTLMSNFQSIGGLTSSLTKVIAGLGNNLVGITNPSTFMIYIGLGLVGLYLFSSMSKGGSSPPVFLSSNLSPYDRLMRSGGGGI